jgi:RNA recognition motif-containing protein
VSSTVIKVHVGNLSSLIAESDLIQLFSRYGTVRSAEVVGQDSARRGFGFVVMEHDDQAKAAIGALNGLDIEGQSLSVHEWRPRQHDGYRPHHAGAGRARRSSGRFGDRSNNDDR